MLQEEERFVAFIDVLGFREVLAGSSQNDVQRYYDALRLIPLFHAPGIHKFILGDAIVISTPASETESLLKNLAELCIAIATIQQKLAAMDIWTRGAITKGSTFRDSDGVFTGAALVKAIELEDSLALYPRVILDTQMIDDEKFRVHHSIHVPGQLISSLNAFGFESEAWKNRVLFDWSIDEMGAILTDEGRLRNSQLEKDVPLFIDYFSTFAGTKPDKNSLDFVMRFLERRVRSNLRHYKKYRWVASYLSETLHRAGETFLDQAIRLEQL